ncbi:peptidoglycan-binding protein [Leifsonia sp. ZF2019]|uniref:peptidoglycan-binding domain-containing protein n=1 Tax=Leifsonia sp. ZF2019 TaxID=2781978 RepID=UPI001CBFF383|nr:peptidoglycan-binding domain-containing protein [Leifsonia sp. ZF2019]UAJ78691.1 peptidoglycan-binding protein [Leifsonia sp. ZF2019]
MSRRLLSRITLLSVIGIVLFAGGACAAWLWFSPAVPASLAGPSAAAEAPIAYRDFTDPRTVSLAFTSHPESPLVSEASGRLTASSCSPGTTVESGLPFASMNGEPLIALATSAPLWRDLAAGDRGDDVRSLQAELTRLGFPVTNDGAVGTQTLAAVAKLFARAGDDALPATTISTARFVWLPTPATTILACDAHVGESLGVGGTLATAVGGLASVSIVPLPRDLVDGARTLTVDEVTVPVDRAGDVTATEALSALAGTPSYASATASSRETGSASEAISGQLALEAPVEIATVPPTAVHSVRGNSGCLSSRGTGYPVTIVGSQLGQTFVRFAGEARPTSADLSPTGDSACS